MKTREKRLVSLIVLVTLLLCGLTACSDRDRLYHDEIAVEWLDSPYIPENIWFDNDWLQKRA